MEKAKILIYDGSFNGFLTAVYTAYELRLQVSGIRKRNESQEVLFAKNQEIKTDVDKARRVWQAIEQKNYQAVKKIYFAFLSERKGVEHLLYRYIQSLFARASDEDASALVRLYDGIEAMAYRVGQEKKKTEASLRFVNTDGSARIATISPRANILPLIAKYFRSRIPNGSWIVYDKKRKYGLYYHHHQMELLRLSNEEAARLALSAAQVHGDTSWKSGPHRQATHSPVGKNFNMHQSRGGRKFELQGNSAA